MSAEIAARRADGSPEYPSVQALNEALHGMGYRLDRSMDCRSTAQHVSGPRAGATYPCMTTGIIELCTGLSFAHVDSTRADDHRALQALRLAGAFVVLRDCLLDL